MRKAFKIGLFGAFLLTGMPALAAQPGANAVDQLEMLEWSDPERAAQMIDAAPPTADAAAEIDMLEIRGMIYADDSREEDVYAVERRLEAIAGAGNEAAVRAGRFVRAYSARLHNQFAAAEAELKGIDMNAIKSDSERYRVLSLRGHVLRFLGQDEAALPFLEQALDLGEQDARRRADSALHAVAGAHLHGERQFRPRHDAAEHGARIRDALGR